MLTRARLPYLPLSDDWKKDGPRLQKWLQDYFLSLERPGLLYITEATGGFNTLSADALGVEGTSWTPTITAATPGNLSVAYSVQIGERLELGGLNIAHFRLTTSTWTHTTAAGDLHITGLANTAATLANLAWVGGSLEFSGLTKANYTQFSPRVASADNKILIRACGSAQAAAVCAVTDFPTGGTVILNGTVIYRA